MTSALIPGNPVFSNPLTPFGWLYFYVAGTTTPQAAYSDSTGSTPLANPLQLDSNGQATFWLKSGLAYKINLVDVNLYQQPHWPVDNILADPANSNGVYVALAAANGASLVGYQRSETGAQAFTLGAQQQDRPLSIKLDFGAKGDGVTNDTAAFQNLSAAINAQGGGDVIIEPGTYIVGQQTFAGATGKGYSYLAANILNLLNCALPITISGYGAKMKFAAGMFYGQFSPTAPATPTTPNTANPDYAASLGIMINATGCANVVVNGLECDGNIANQVIGGPWGNTAIQLSATGIFPTTCNQFLAQNCWTHHFGLDGMQTYYAAEAETDTAHPQVFINCISEYNGRQGLSWIGGSNLTAISCAFNHQGKNGYVNSSPAAGVDIEPYAGVNRYGLFLGCEFMDNAGVGQQGVGNSSGIEFIHCRFVGTTNYSAWPGVARTVYRDCIFIGTIVNALGDATYPDNATRFYGCKFTDEVGFATTTYANGGMINFASAANVLLEDCTIIASKQTLAYMPGALLRNCQFFMKAGTESGITNGSTVLTLTGCQVRDTTITDQIINVPSGYYLVYFNGSEVWSGTNQIISGSNKLVWPTVNIAGIYGRNDSGQTSPFWSLGLSRSNGGNPLSNAAATITMGPAAPTTGAYTAGSVCYNSSPAVGQPKAWSCTVSGTPGTWVSQGNL